MQADEPLFLFAAREVLDEYESSICDLKFLKNHEFNEKEACSSVCDGDVPRASSIIERRQTRVPFCGGNLVCMPRFDKILLHEAK